MSIEMASPISGCLMRNLFFGTTVWETKLMKSCWILLALGSLFLFGCAPADQGSGGTENLGSDDDSNVTVVLPTESESAPTFDWNNESLTLVKFNVPAMTCPEGCPPAVKSALTHCDGVDQVEVDYDTKTATVAVSSENFDAQSAVAALAEFGFDNSTVQN